MAEASETRDNSSSMAAGSEVTFEIIVCTPCDDAGDTNKAETYCLQCAEYLCVTCKKYHSRLAGAKHHTLVDKDNLSGTQGSLPFNDICTERCQIHRDEMIKYYCPAHSALGCGDCMIHKHDTCNGKAYIPDEAKNLDNNKEFKDFQELIDTLTKKSNNIIKSSQVSIQFTAECRVKTLQEIETFRQEMNDALDELKAVLDDQTEKAATRDEDLMNSIADRANQVLAQLQSISSDLKTFLNKRQHCQLFIEMKCKTSKVADLKKQLKDIDTYSQTAFRFKPNEELQRMVKRRYALGVLLQKNSTETIATHVADINARTSGNRNTCNISDATLLSKDKLVIIDWKNQTLKLINTATQQIVFEYKPETLPYDVTRVNNTRIAVTLPSAKKIMFMMSEDTLTPDTEICVNQQCCYIAFIDYKLVVSFKDPHEVRILSLTGETLQTFSTSSTGERLFSWVPRVAVSAFTRAIYATNWDGDRVTILGMEGNVIAQFKEHDLKNPTHSAVDDMGMLYMCQNYSNNIHLLTPYCSKVKILLTEREGIRWPQSVCFCEETRRLYVGMNENDVLKVFQLSCATQYCMNYGERR